MTKEPQDAIRQGKTVLALAAEKEACQDLSFKNLKPKKDFESKSGNKIRNQKLLRKLFSVYCGSCTAMHRHDDAMLVERKLKVVTNNS